MNVFDWLSGTRVASWSDKKHHRETLGMLLKSHFINGIKKAYLLGYASALVPTQNRISACIARRSVWGLRQVFQALAYGEDEVGATVIEPMCAVYLLIGPDDRTVVAAIRNPDKVPQLLFFMSASGFLYWWLCGKRLVIE